MQHQPLLTKPLPCPDGVTRLVTLQTGFWEYLDWIIKERGVDYAHLIAYLWNVAKEEDDPEYQLAAGLEHFIHTYVQDFIQEEDGLANDSRFNPDWPQTAAE